MMKVMYGVVNAMQCEWLLHRGRPHRPGRIQRSDPDTFCLPICCPTAQRIWLPQWSYPRLHSEKRHAVEDVNVNGMSVSL